MKLRDYILFIFGKHEEQEKFIKDIAEEISVISDSPNVRFYYGPESGVFTFQTIDEFEDTKEFIELMFNQTNVGYFLLPYKYDKMSAGIPEDIIKHLFNLNNNENVTEFGFEAQEVLSNQLKEKVDKFFNEDEDEDEILKIKSKLPVLTVDDILDKINEKGIRSLTKEELSLLENYSK